MSQRSIRTNVIEVASAAAARLVALRGFVLVLVLVLIITSGGAG